MSCCGGKRREWRVALPAKGQEIQPARLIESEGVVFEYGGPATLSVRGAITGRPYRFRSAGDRQAVDLRDAPGFKAIPGLRRVSE
jgi:hypothetical protein